MVRRIITAEDDAGRSVFAKVEEVVPLAAKVGWHPVWSWDAVPQLPFRLPSSAYSPSSVYPRPGGINIVVTEFPAGFGVDPNIELDQSDQARYDALLDPRTTVDRPHGDAGLHRHATVDILVVISGEIGLEQEDGVEVTLRQGDVVVQMGGLHAWRHRGTQPCLIAFVLVGTERLV